jgi:hypothetical protein
MYAEPAGKPRKAGGQAINLPIDVVSFGTGDF